LSWLVLLSHIANWSIVLPMLLGFLFLKKLDRDSRIILFIVTAGAVPQLMDEFSTLTGTMLFEPIIWILYNIYITTEFITYFFLFRSKINHQKARDIMLASSVIFLVSTAILYHMRDIKPKFIFELAAASYVIQLSWVFMGLLSYYTSEDELMSTRRPYFWFLIGIAAYAACTAPYFCIWSYANAKYQVGENILNLIHYVFNTFLYLSFAVGMIMNIRPMTIKTSDDA
jgi:hypothetical protein